MSKEPVQRKKFAGQWWMVVVTSVIVLLIFATWYYSEQPAEKKFFNASLPEGGPAPAAAFAAKISPVDGMELVFVPEGQFEMGLTDEALEAQMAGCTDCQQEWFSDEQPSQKVDLDAFWIDRTEVTNGMYYRCMDAGICVPPYDSGSVTRKQYYGNPDYDDYPVLFVDWAQAASYCEWAGRRLPTEAEWEKAARGTDGRTFPWGEGIDEDRLNFNWMVGDTTAVGSYPHGASPYGALDMAGNVWEWTADWYAGDFYSHSPIKNPGGPGTGEEKVVRGGAWHNSEVSMRSTTRSRGKPDEVESDIGFRCVVSDIE